MKQRDYGIDLLRLFAMGLIVLHHLLVHGGLLFALPTFSTTGMAMELLNAFTRSAVNAYALISGYVMVRAAFRPSKLLSLWLQVVFYSVLAILCLPLMTPGARATPGDWLRALLPITHDSYWYFTCYAPVFLLSPALNALLHSLNRQQAGFMMTALLVLFTLLPLIALGDLFQMNGGYHCGWLMILYLLGGYLRLHGFGRMGRKGVALLVLLACTFIAWASRLGLLALGASKYSELLLNYNAPTMLFCGVALLSLFRESKLPAWAQKGIAVLSPLTFGVYLIHENTLVREHVIKLCTASLADVSPIALVIALTIGWALIYLFCLLVEWLRTRLFMLLRIPALCQRAENRLLNRAMHADG